MKLSYSWSEDARPHSNSMAGVEKQVDVFEGPTARPLCKEVKKEVYS